MMLNNLEAVVNDRPIREVALDVLSRLGWTDAPA